MTRLAALAAVLPFALALGSGCRCEGTGADAGPGTDGGGPAGDGGPGTDGGGPTTDGGGAGCDTITTFETGLSPTAEIHVSTSGSDTAGDGTAVYPYATIDRAVQDAVPGSAVVVHEGTYPGGSYVGMLAGTAAGPIWIGGAAGEARPVLDGFGEGIHLSNIRYVVLHDLEVVNATGNGINTDDSGLVSDPEATRWVVFRNLDIHDIGGGGNEDCLKLSGVNDFWVLDSSFARCGGGGAGSGIDCVGCRRGLVARSAFTEMAGNAIQTKGASEDVELRWNVVIDGGERAFNMGGSTGLTFFRPPLDPATPAWEARDIRAIANVIVRGTTPFAFVGCVDCLAANNTVVDPQNWLMRILQETVSQAGYTFLPSGDSRVINNLFYFDRSTLSGEDINVGAGTDPGSFVFANNLWYAHDDPSQSAPVTLPVTETSAVIGMDPMLANPAGGGYSLDPNSPAGGAGMDLVELVADLAGRCWLSPPAVGAYEVP